VKRVGILNRELAAGVAGMGRTEWLVVADAGLPVRLLRCCVDDPYLTDELGDEAFLHELHGLSAVALERRLLDFGCSVR